MNTDNELLPFLEYPLLESANLARLLFYDKKILEQRGRLKEILESKGLVSYFFRTSSYRKLSKFVGSDPFFLWIRDYVCHDGEKGRSLWEYIQNYYPFAGNEIVKQLDPELYQELQLENLLKFVPTEEELEALKDQSKKNEDRRKKIIQNFHERLGMPKGYKSSGGLGDVSAIYPDSIPEEDVLRGILQLQKILGDAANEYSYGIRLILAHTKAQKRDPEKEIINFGRKVYREKYRTHRLTGEIHSKTGFVQPEFKFQTRWTARSPINDELTETGHIGK